MAGADPKDPYNDEEATNPVRAPYREPPGAPRYRLVVVVGDGLPVTHPLTKDQVLLGRSADADVQIEDGSLSRRHATLTLGPRLHVQDHGSLNGTTVRGARLPAHTPVEIQPGEVVEFGSVMTIVQRSREDAPPGRLLTHGYFDTRLEEECARAQQTGAHFAVLRVRVEEPATAEQEAAVLTFLHREALVVATWGPREYELLIPNLDATGARGVAARLTRDADVKGVRLHTGAALFPEDGRSAGELTACAGDALRAPARNLEGAAHPVVEPTARVGSPMERLGALLTRVAQSNISVILQGETGVGKEVAARLLHRSSRRAERPFVGINCGALAESLLETELFGHERGAFSGAVRAKAGLLESADGGTFFLDEIGEMPLSLQVKLLRVLEEREVTRVGAVRPKAVDIRVVCATHRNLDEEVAHGRFREDLYYRLNGITLQLPPLRERIEDLEGLALQFTTEFAAAEHKATPAITPLALELMRSYTWPGNIRELRNVMERAVTLCAGDAITLEHLPLEKMSSMLKRRRAEVAAPPEAARRVPTPAPRASFDALTTNPMGGTAPASLRSTTPPPSERAARPPEATSGSHLKLALKELERDRILEALRQCAGNQSRAAEALGISRRALVNRLDEYGIPRPRKQ